MENPMNDPAARIDVSARPLWSIPRSQNSKDQPILPPETTTDGTLRRIQEEALIRFADRGFHGVSVREIAEAVGVRPASIYAHFRSKEDLLHGLIELGHRVHTQALRGALLNAGSDPAEQLRSLMHAHVEVHARFAMLATVANNELAMLSSELREDIITMRLDSQRMFTEVVERGVAMGRFLVTDVWLAVAAMGAMGLRVSAWFAADGPYTVDEVAETYAQYALKLVR
jgi:AcrR family transcriptional regulator